MPPSSISISTLSRSPRKASVRGPPPRTSAPAATAESAARPSNSRSASTVRQLNAAWPARMNVSSSGSSRRAVPSSCSSSSSVHLGKLTLATSLLAAGGRNCGQVGPHGMSLPEPVQAPPESRADAPDRHLQQPADLVIGLRRIGGAQPQELLISCGQLVQPRSEEHTSELQSRENLVC